MTRAIEVFHASRLLCKFKQVMQGPSETITIALMHEQFTIACDDVTSTWEKDDVLRRAVGACQSKGRGMTGLLTATMPTPQKTSTQRGVETAPQLSSPCRYMAWTAAKGPAAFAVSFAPWA